MGITWKDRVTNEEVKHRIRNIIGTYEPLIEVARRRKLQWFGHVTRRPGTLAHTIMHGQVKGKRTRGRPKTSWLTNIAEWTRKTIVTCVREAIDRKKWWITVQSSKCPNGPRTMGMT